MSSQKIESYDVSAKMRAILEFRQERRLQLRQQYLRDCMNPAKQLLLGDTAADRFANLRNLHDYRLKIEGRRMGVCTLIIFGSIVLLGYALDTSKGAYEKKLRSGEVAYADRHTKIM